MLEINHKDFNGVRDEFRGRTVKFYKAIILGRRSIEDLELLCANCHTKFHKRFWSNSDKINNLFKKEKLKFFTSISNAEMSYPSSEDSFAEINEELDDGVSAIDYDYGWLEDYENRRTSKENLIFGIGY